MKNYDILYPLNHQEEKKYIKADGAVYTDENGRNYVDLDEMCIVLGQNNKGFIETVSEALKGITSGKLGYSKAKQQLHRYLIEAGDDNFIYVHLTSSGSEAAEWAVKLAKKITGRSEVISCWNSIHGRTQLSASMSGLPRRKALYGPLESGIMFIPYPEKTKTKGTEKFDVNAWIKLVDDKYKYESAHDVAAVVIESVQGAGVKVPEDGSLLALYNWAKGKGILFIMDDIQMGMGRGGQIFNYKDYGFVPDMILMGKALGNGMHIAGFMVKKGIDIKTEWLGALAGGTGDDVIACSASNEVLRQLNGGLLAHIQEVSAFMKAELEKLAAASDSVIDVRIKGFAAAIEYDSAENCLNALNSAKTAGFMPGKFGDNTICIKPPYVITKEQAADFIRSLY